MKNDEQQKKNSELLEQAATMLAEVFVLAIDHKFTNTKKKEKKDNK